MFVSNGFFADVAGGETRPVGIRICVIRCDGKPSAIEISFRCADHVFGHVLSYDPAFAKQGIGILVAASSIRHAHQQGFVQFDLLAPRDAHKSEWADAAVLVDDYLKGFSTAGALYARVWLCHCAAMGKAGCSAALAGAARGGSFDGQRALARRASRRDNAAGALTLEPRHA